MKSLVALFLITSLTVKISAQVNLVPNPSFEDTTGCPTNISQLNKCIFWINPNSAGPDYFNSCADYFTTYSSVPFNAFGFQQAHTGNAYVGLLLYQKTISGGAYNYREYIQTTLNDTLKKDANYCVSFFINYSSVINIAIDQVGLFISNNAISASTPITLPASPQIISPSGFFLTDTVNWYKVEGIYSAAGGEKFITIGNFRDETSTDTIHTDSNPPSCAYYYIDDVSIIEIKTARAGADTLICPGEPIQIGALPDSAISYSWQPATGLNNPNISNPTANPSQTTTYYLTATAACDYISTDTIIVSVLTCDTNNTVSSISIPNVFTPNNDHVNDLFKITTNNITTFNCKIYNQWGVLVNELTNINQSWGGRTTTGIECSEGIYYFLLSAEGTDDKIYNESGFVQLIR
jgi:gliding motility-associated-like protein